MSQPSPTSVSPEVGPARWQAVRSSIGRALDTPWPIIAVPALGYLFAHRIAPESLPIADFLAFAAAYFAGRRWPLDAMLPVILMCIPFLAEVPAALMPGNFWTIPAILFAYRIGADPPWLARLLSRAETGLVDLAALFFLMLAGCFNLLAFANGLILASAPAALLLPLLFVLMGMKRTPLGHIFGALLAACGFFWITIWAWLPSEALIRFADFRLGLAPLDLVTCIAALALGRTLSRADRRTGPPDKFGLSILFNAVRCVPVFAWCFLVQYMTLGKSGFDLPDLLCWLLEGRRDIVWVAVASPTLSIVAGAHLAIQLWLLAASAGAREARIFPVVGTLIVYLVAAVLVTARVIDFAGAAVLAGCAVIAGAIIRLVTDQLANAPVDDAARTAPPFMLMVLGRTWLAMAVLATLVIVAVPLGISASNPEALNWAFTDSGSSTSARPTAGRTDKPGELTPDDIRRLDAAANNLDDAEAPPAVPGDYGNTSVGDGAASNAS